MSTLDLLVVVVIVAVVAMFILGHICYILWLLVFTLGPIGTCLKSERETSKKETKTRKKRLIGDVTYTNTYSGYDYKMYKCWFVLYVLANICIK